MVLKYVENGSLQNYLDTNYNKLRGIRNILSNSDSFITDMGSYKPAGYNALKNTKNRIYGIWHIASEILRGQNRTPKYIYRNKLSYDLGYYFSNIV
ncbi:hypothetical protein C1645_841363 [Glomus cerebriforme]|uniref:Uncharacterized protein n=1 Tax=Glomus cerebriforme TaxID=658196 RepID=A0A397RZP3_9GLOM|nr:hypothetical protein C1645_841363 [Glomus cerebriforme]